MIAACILLVHAILLLLPGRCWPEWSHVFIKEPDQEPEELESKRKRPFGRRTAALLVSSSLGFSVQAVTVLYSSFRYHEVFSAIAWVC